MAAVFFFSAFVLLGLVVGAPSSSSNPKLEGLANEYVGMYVQNGSYVFKVHTFEEGETPSALKFHSGEVIVGKYNTSYEVLGWDLLELHTNPDFTDEEQAFAAGYWEGYFTSQRIYQYAVNTGVTTFVPSQNFSGFIDANYNFMLENIQKAALLPSGDPERIYWWQVHLVMTQLGAMFLGYKNGSQPGEDTLTQEMIYLINLQGDMEDLSIFQSSEAPTREELRFSTRTKCSALVRILDNNEDIFIAQDTWSSFTSMMRIFKLYDFPFTLDNTTGSVPARRSSFSSYPGSLFSGDDFYVLSNGLVVQETTIGYSDPSLAQYIVPSSVLEWLRNIVANRLSSDTTSWVNVYSKFNSGTYNNMNMILDYKLFTPGKPIQPNTFYICEQIPGLIRSNDMSSYLQQNRYFGSYNAAYDPMIRNVSGADQDVLDMGLWFTYDRTPRALIFSRDHSKVTDMDSMKKMMRYNDFLNDSLSTQIESCMYVGMTNCTPFFTSENTIACRDDLNPADGVYAFGSLGQRNHAAIDAKISSFSSYDPVSLAAQAQSGPTYDTQPIFQFSTSPYAQLSHIGMPDQWQFPWITVSWD